MKKSPHAVAGLSPALFERVIADRLERMGYLVTLAGTAAREHGIDKLHSAVNEIIALKNMPFHLGLIVTNASFTADTKWLAGQTENRNFVRLRDGRDVRWWLRDNFDRERVDPEPSDEIEISPGLRVKIPPF